MNSLDILAIVAIGTSLLGARYLYLDLQRSRWRNERLAKRNDELHARLALAEKRNIELLDDLDLAVVLADTRMTSQQLHPSVRGRALTLIDGGAS